jgi:hypothetical protein
MMPEKRANGLQYAGSIRVADTTHIRPRPELIPQCPTHVGEGKRGLGQREHREVRPVVTDSKRKRTLGIGIRTKGLRERAQTAALVDRDRPEVGLTTAFEYRDRLLDIGGGHRRVDRLSGQATAFAVLAKRDGAYPVSMSVIKIDTRQLPQYLAEPAELRFLSPPDLGEDAP